MNLRTSIYPFYQNFGRLTLVLSVGLSNLSTQAQTPGVPTTAAPPGAIVYFISPKNGAKLKNPVKVVFGLRGMGVAPAGVKSPNTGHHHLIVDAALPPAGAVIPNDANHRHFGMGQTETEIELAPGKHTLQLILGDQNHIPFVPSIHSEKITIQVD